MAILLNLVKKLRLIRDLLYKKMPIVIMESWVHLNIKQCVPVDRLKFLVNERSHGLASLWNITQT